MTIKGTRDLGSSRLIETHTQPENPRPALEGRQGSEQGIPLLDQRAPTPSRMPIGAEALPAPKLNEARTEPFQESEFMPAREKAVFSQKPEISQSLVSRFFSWLFGTSKKEPTKLEQHFASLQKESAERSKLTNKVLVLDRLAKELGQNPLGTTGTRHQLEFDGLSAQEKAKLSEGISKKGAGYMPELRKLSPSDQFQVLLELARDFKKSTGKSLLDLAGANKDMRPDVALLMKMADYETASPKEAVESLKQMGASLVRSGAASAEQVGTLLEGALGNPTGVGTSKLAEEISDRASTLPEPTTRAQTPQERKEARIAKDRATSEAEKSKNWAPELENRLSKRLESALRFYGEGRLSKEALGQEFEDAFAMYDSYVTGLNPSASSATSTRPEKMLSLLDQFNALPERPLKAAQIQGQVAQGAGRSRPEQATTRQNQASTSESSQRSEASKKGLSPLEAHLQSLGQEAKETSRTTNKVLVLSELAKFLAANPLGANGKDEAFSFDGLTAGEKTQHLQQIQDQGNRYMKQLRSLSPSDQFQVLLELARDLKNTTGTPLGELAEKKAALSTPTQALLGMARVKTTTPEEAVESLKQMGASLVRSGVASPLEIGNLLQRALENPSNEGTTRLAEEISQRAAQLPEPSARAATPQERKEAKIAEARASDAAVKNQNWAPELENRLSNRLESALRSYREGKVNKEALRQEFEDAFGMYDSYVTGLSARNPEAIDARPEKMLALLDQFNNLPN